MKHFFEHFAHFFSPPVSWKKRHQLPHSDLQETLPSSLFLSLSGVCNRRSLLLLPFLFFAPMPKTALIVRRTKEREKGKRKEEEEEAPAETLIRSYLDNCLTEEEKKGSSFFLPLPLSSPLGTLKGGLGFSQLSLSVSCPGVLALLLCCFYWSCLHGCRL